MGRRSSMHWRDRVLEVGTWPCVRVSWNPSQLRYGETRRLIEGSDSAAGHFMLCSTTPLRVSRLSRASIFSASLSLPRCGRLVARRPGACRRSGCSRARGSGSCCPTRPISSSSTSPCSRPAAWWSTSIRCWPSGRSSTRSPTAGSRSWRPSISTRCIGKLARRARAPAGPPSGRLPDARHPADAEAAAVRDPAAAGGGQHPRPTSAMSGSSS